MNAALTVALIFVALAVWVGFWRAVIDRAISWLQGHEIIIRWEEEDDAKT